MSFQTIDDIRKANVAIGNYWFSPNTMEFFGTKIESEVIGGRYFVTTEQPPHGPRIAMLREADPSGSVSTVDGPEEMGAFPSIEAAMDKAAELAAERKENV